MEEMARELTDPTLELLEEFTTAWLRGETPDPREALDRAPENERAELSDLIDRFLVRQPGREPTAETLAYVQAIAAGADEAQAITEPPLLEARNRLGMKRATVVAQLRGALGLRKSDESKLGRYYHRLENGLLDASRVSDRVWAALEGILQWRGDPTHPQPLAAEATAFFRMADSSGPPDSELAASLGFGEEPEPAGRDEVDALFLGSAPD